MALPSTIFQLSLEVSDLDRQHYESYRLTLAQHPSETDQRFMMRIISFCLNASTELQFSKGLSDENEAALSKQHLNSDIALWIDFGQLEEKRLKRACQRAEQVILYLYNENQWKPWWKKHEKLLSRHQNLTIIVLETDSDELSKLYQRNLDLSCLIDEGVLYLSDQQHRVAVTPQRLK